MGQPIADQRPRSDTAGPSVRRVFLVGCPRSRTTVAQVVFSQACGLVTMSTNWWLSSSGTTLLNGPEGEPRSVTRPFARQRVADRLAEAGVDLPAGFAVQDALDRLAAESGSPGWLEKTPLHVLTVREIEDEVSAARFVHLLRDPHEVVGSLLRRAAANPSMRGAAWQLVQTHAEAIWRECVRASLACGGASGHLMVDAAEFMSVPELVAARVAAFVDVPYRAPDEAARVAQARAATASSRPWKHDAAQGVRAIAHADDVAVAPLESDTVDVWARARALLQSEQDPAGRDGSEAPVADDAAGTDR